MSSNFPLFRLPLVALQVVVNHLHLNHLVILSFCSQRAQKSIKILRKRNRNINIQMVFCSYARIDLSDKFKNGPMSMEIIRQTQYSEIYIKHETPEEQKIEMVRIGEHTIPVYKKIGGDGESIMEFQFSDRFSGIKLIASYFTWLFGNPIHELLLSSDMFPDQVRRTIDWTVSRQKSIEMCYVECRNTSDEQIKRILDSCNFVSSFFLLVNPSPLFTHQFVFERDLIYLKNAFWFNLENLFNINCRVCHVLDSMITSLELNQYLKQWRAGQFLKVKRLEIEMDEIHLETLLAGLDSVNFPQGVERVYINEDYKEITVSYGFDIKNVNSTTATIVHQGGNFNSRHFLMIVW